ncbi:Uncharacterized protein YR821_1367 [Yersinia ruckeri]|nr:hypothetical protein yruck0001_17570 [Yersinia ruckeri ATCC 29473]QTD76294.1 Uncharacterized protein YR821_1367 [Yersinia ruckeri]
MDSCWCDTHILTMKRYFFIGMMINSTLASVTMNFCSIKPNQTLQAMS